MAFFDIASPYFKVFFAVFFNNFQNLAAVFQRKSQRDPHEAQARQFFLPQHSICFDGIFFWLSHLLFTMIMSIPRKRR